MNLKKKFVKHYKIIFVIWTAIGFLITSVQYINRKETKPSETKFAKRLYEQHGIKRRYVTEKDDYLYSISIIFTGMILIGGIGFFVEQNERREKDLKTD